MQYLYLDESGDLGFDFVNKKPSKFFTVAVLVLNSADANRKFTKAVKKVLARKLNQRKRRKRIVKELKGADTIFEVKAYLYKLIKDLPFEIYAVTLNKRRAYEYLIYDKSKIYNFVARQVLDHIPFEKDNFDRVEFIIDKSKNKPETAEFNLYIRHQLEGRLNPKTVLDMYHWQSHEAPGLQAADMFAWGIFQKYEKGKTEWLNLFKDKIKFCGIYLSDK